MYLAHAFAILIAKMSGKKASAPEGLVTSDAVYHGHFGRKILLIFGAIIVVAGVGYYLTSQHTLQKIGLFTDKAANGGNNQSANVTPQQAISQAKDQVSSAQTPKDKASAYQALGAAYMTNNQPAQALQSYQTSLSSAQDTNSKAAALSGIANAYLQSGDKQQAITAFQQIVALYQQSSDPDLQALIPKYQNLISELEGPDDVPGN